MPQGPDFPDIDASIQRQTLTFDFGNLVPPGTSLIDPPTIAISVVRGTDPDPSSRLVGSPVIGVAVRPFGSGGPAVLQQVGNMVAGATYLLVVECPATNGDIPSIWSHIKCVEPQ